MDESARQAARGAAIKHIHSAAAVDECPLSGRYLAQRHGASWRAGSDCFSRVMAGGEYQAETEPSENPMERPSRDLARKPGHVWRMRKSADGKLHTAARAKACVLSVPGREEARTGLPATAGRRLRSRRFAWRALRAHGTDVCRFLAASPANAHFVLPLRDATRLRRTARWESL